MRTSGRRHRWGPTSSPSEPLDNLLPDAWLATHPDVPGTMVATSVWGQVYVTDDHAESWRKLDRDFGEIRAVAITPAA